MLFINLIKLILIHKLLLINLSWIQYSNLNLKYKITIKKEFKELINLNLLFKIISKTILKLLKQDKIN
jgi:hypothetical protein